MEKLNTWIRGAVTVVLLGLVVGWLVVVYSRLGSAPQLDDKGNVILDEYQRAKDILLVVLPLVTTAIGYWFGVQGKEAADERADKATQETKAVLAASTDATLLDRARRQYPTAFGPAGVGGESAGPDEGGGN